MTFSICAHVMCKLLGDLKALNTGTNGFASPGNRRCRKRSGEDTIAVFGMALPMTAAPY
jgi:hypothetical protein